MALPVRQQLIYWGIAAVALLVVLWAMGDVILPFIVGRRHRLFPRSRGRPAGAHGAGPGAATVLIFILLTLVVVLAALIVMPTLVQQATDLVQAAPEIFEQLGPS
jgi:predicted PurR-regulated permease PerM